jgi:hypothetical protein
VLDTSAAPRASSPPLQLPLGKQQQCGSSALLRRRFFVNRTGKNNKCMWQDCASSALTTQMFTKLEFDLEKDYAAPYTTSRNTYLQAAAALKLATGPYKAARDAYVAATATYTKSLYE